MSKKPLKISDLRTIVAVWAHPDDESRCAGGLLAAARLNGQRVVVVTATSGEKGESADETRWPQKNIGEIRKRELETALHHLGVIESHMLGCPDGGLDSVDSEPYIDSIATILQDVQPDTIVSFGADGITGHPDHRSIHNWTVKAVEKSKLSAVMYCAVENSRIYELFGKPAHEKFNVYCDTPEPLTVTEEEADFFLNVEGEVLERKLQAIKAHECQYAAMWADKAGTAYLIESAEVECYVKQQIPKNR